jgi:hypothetical protein
VRSAPGRRSGGSRGRSHGESKKGSQEGHCQTTHPQPGRCLYYSGDANDDGCLAIGNDCWAAPKNLKGYWQWPFDLEVLVLAGCSALNITFSYGIANGPGTAWGAPCSAGVSSIRSSNRVLRSCSCALFPWGAELSLRFRAKNMADDVFQLESELPNIPKLLTKPRPGSPCPRNSHAMVLLCCPGRDTLAVGLTSWLRITSCREWVT